MKPRPTTYVKLALRAARRRRYGYAALRVLRRGLVRAVDAHLLRSIGADPYVSEADAIYVAYRRALAELLRRFPRVRFDDDRGRP